MCLESIRPEDIFRYRGNGKGILIDVRTNEEFLSGHIPEAVNIPYEEIQNRIEEIRQLTDSRKGEGSAFLILYCDHGNTSLRAARDLYRMGFAVKNVYGGLSGYRGPLVKPEQKEEIAKVLQQLPVDGRRKSR